MISVERPMTGARPLPAAAWGREPIPPHLQAVAAIPALWTALILFARTLQPDPETLPWLAHVAATAFSRQQRDIADAVGWMLLHPEHLL